MSAQWPSDRVLPGGDKPTTSLGFGCAHLSGGFEMRASRRLVDAAFDAGLRHFDAAPAYGMGIAEDVLGEVLKTRRQQVTITTKAGIARPAISPLMLAARVLARPLRRLVPARIRRNLGNAVASSARGQFAPALIAQSLTESLRRLKTDYVDVFLLHEVRLEDLSDQLLSLLQQVRQEGKVRAIGIASIYPAATEIARMYGGVFDIFQYSWSVLEPEILPPDSTAFTITHRAIRRACGPMRHWFSADPAAMRRLSDVVGIDLAVNDVLADALLAAGLACNPKGIVLAASRQVSRIQHFGAVMRDKRLHEAGMRLASALTREKERPAPED